MRCVSSEGVDLSQLPLLSSPAPHLHLSSNPPDGVITMGTAVKNNQCDLTSDSDKVTCPAVGNTTENVFQAASNPASLVSSTNVRMNNSAAPSEEELSQNCHRSSLTGMVRDSYSNDRLSASTPSSSSSLTDNEKHPSSSTSNSSLKTASLSSEDKHETPDLKGDASVLFRSSASSLTIIQSSKTQMHTSAFSSTSSLCTSESESESHVSNGIGVSSAVPATSKDMPANTAALCDVADTSCDLDDTITASCDDGETSGDVEHIYENTMFCASSPTVRDHNATLTLTKDSEEEGKENDVIYQNVSDTASVESSGNETSTYSQPRASSHECSPLPTFSFSFEEEASPLSKDLIKGPETKPTLPERYRHVLRRNGSYGNLGGCHNGGGRGSDQDLTSREKDLGSALAWIRHEIVEMKEQDKLLLKRFIELRASILQLRCMYDVLGSTSDLSSMDGSCVSLNEVRKSPRMHSLVRTESDAMMSGGMFKATSSLSLPCSPQLSRLRWTSDDLI